jgi:Ca-activated chloride channel family protein
MPFLIVSGSARPVSDDPRQRFSRGGGDGAPYRAAIDLVVLNVVVNNASGGYVDDLRAGDFRVTEDGVPQTLTFFDHATVPISLVLLLDTSASMQSKLPHAQDAAVGFVRRLRPQDQAEVIRFDARVDLLQPFTNDIAQIERAIRKTTPGGNTSLYNAVYVALGDLHRVIAGGRDDVRRTAIIVLSDGEDTSSLLPFEDVLDSAKRSSAVIYSIGLRAETDLVPVTRGSSEAEFVLREFARQTGGRTVFTSRAPELNGVYDQIAAELRSQYTIGYVSSNPHNDGRWRRLDVRVDRPSATARTRPGYFAAPASHTR